MQITLGDLAKQKFDDTAKSFEDAMSFIEHRANMVNKVIDRATEEGYISAIEYYVSLTNIENENLKALKNEREALVVALADAVNSGAVEEGSEAWYEMQNQIYGVTEAIEDSEKALVSYSNSMRDIRWEIFDRVEDTIANITDETEFLMSLLEEEKNFIGGDITKEGRAAYGLHAVNYQTYMEQAADYAEEIKKINKDLATDPYDTVLIDRRKELIKLQREMIQNAEEEKDAMKDLTEEGVKSFLDAMKESIDAYKEMMSEWKNDDTFKKNIEEQTSAIAKLQKQLNAYQNDDSEAGMLNRQKTENSLMEAQEKLEESQRDHYISETEKILDDLYTEAETALNLRLDHFEELLTQIFDGINMNASAIADTLHEVTGEVYTELSDTMEQIWTVNAQASIDGQTQSIISVLSQYGEMIGTVPNNVSDAIESIAYGVKLLSAEAEKQAKAELKKQEEEAKKTTVTQAIAAKKSTVQSNTVSQSVPSTSGANAATTNTNATSTGNKGSFFVPKTYVGLNRSALNIDQSIVDRIAWLGFDNSMVLRSKYYEAMGLGSASSYFGTAQQNIAMLNWMKRNGFKKGVFNSSKNRYAMTQEDGLEVISRPGLGLLTPINRGDTVFTAEQTKALWTLSQNYVDQFANAPKHSGTNIGQVINNNSINVQIAKVEDYNDFVTKLQADNKFERFIKACSTDQLNGKSSISKRRINF